LSTYSVDSYANYFTDFGGFTCFVNMTYSRLEIIKNKLININSNRGKNYSKEKALSQNWETCSKQHSFPVKIWKQVLFLLF